MITGAVYTLMFYLLAAGAIAFALAVVTARRLLRAAVALMTVLTLSAGLYVLLDAEFLAGVQVLVYVGGIVVLIVFAVMLTRSGDLLEQKPAMTRKVWGGLASLLLFLAAALAMNNTMQYKADAGLPAPPDGVRAIGQSLLDFGPSGYVLPFEVISLLLLAAVIGGIVIARRTPPVGQPFTSGGDLVTEVDFHPPHSQREEAGQEGGRA